MARSGEEPWMQWKKVKQRHSLYKLFCTMSDTYKQKAYLKFEKEGYEQKTVDSLMKQLAYAYIQYRYYYQYDDDSDIKDELVQFLRLFWDIAYELSMDAQRDYREKDV